MSSSRHNRDEEFATGRLLTSSSRAPDSPDSSRSSGSSNGSTRLEEPFFSSVSYIQEQQQRLDDDLSSSNNSTRRFHCAPRWVETEDDDIGSRRSSISRQNSLASRFLNEEEDNSPVAAANNKAAPATTSSVNDDLFGFLMGNHSQRGQNKNDNNNNNMWDHHSERFGTVDQSVNLMNTNNTSYEEERHHDRRRSPVKTSHLQALKQPFSFILQPNSPPMASEINPGSTKESRPLVEIDLDNWDDERNCSTGSSKQSGALAGRTKALVLLGCLLLVASTFIALAAVPKHSERLFVFDDNTKDDSSQIDTDAAKGGINSVEDGLNATTKADMTGNRTKTSMAKKYVTGDAVEKSQEGGSVEDKASSAALEPKITDVPSDDSEEETQTEAPTSPFIDELVSKVPQTSRMDAIQYYLEALQVSDPDHLQDPTKAAFRALQWISEENESQMMIPGYNHDHAKQHYEEHLMEILQVYALTVFYFEMQVESDDANYQKTHKRATDIEKQNRLIFKQKFASLHHPICKWHGVQCQDHKVVALNLTRCLLQGTLPKEILEGVALPSLSSLDLSHNKLNGHLPRLSPGSAANPLTELQLQHNHIEGRLDALTDLQSLTYLDVSFNHFNQGLPHKLSKLSNLEFLSVYDNGFGGDIPTSLGNLTKLTSLYLDDNVFAGTVPSELGNLQSLEQLRLLGNGLTGTVPDEICELTSSGSLDFLIADCSHDKITCDCCTQCWRQ